MRAGAVVVVLVLAMAACSDDDSQGTDSTVVDPATTEVTGVATTASTPATSPPSSESPTTTEPTTTAPPPTTIQPIDEEALKAAIAEDYERAFYRGWQMLEAPSLRNLESRAARVLARGSPALNSFVSRIQELVALGDWVVPNDPDLLSATVENVELVGRPPYRRAIVTVCEVTNRKQVTPPENSPTGNEIEVAGTGALEVIRFEEPVRLTGHGWLRYRTPREGIGFDQGETTCPPA